MTLLPSTPETPPLTNVRGPPPYSKLGPPASMVKGSVKMKVVGSLACPRLQIASTGSTIACENEMVSMSEVPPFREIALKDAGGALPIVPPVNELRGVQLG